jgi:hypothetical protein
VNADRVTRVIDVRHGGTWPELAEWAKANGLNDCIRLEIDETTLEAVSYEIQRDDRGRRLLTDDNSGSLLAKRTFTLRTLPPYRTK